MPLLYSLYMLETSIHLKSQFHYLIYFLCAIFINIQMN